MEQITCAVLLYTPGYLIKRPRRAWLAREISLLPGEEYVYDVMVTMVIIVNVYSIIVVNVADCIVGRVPLRDILY